MTLIVIDESLMAFGTESGSSLMSVISLASMATSVPASIAIPISAVVRANSNS